MGPELQMNMSPSDYNHRSTNDTNPSHTKGTSLTTGKIKEGGCYEAAAPSTSQPTRLQIVEINPPVCTVQDAAGSRQSLPIDFVSEWAGRRVSSLDHDCDEVNDVGGLV